MILPPRWTVLRPHSEQVRLWDSPSRFNVIPAGRRSGKTELFKRRVVRCALMGTRFPDARFFVGAPTYGQAKRIFWNDLKALVPKEFMAGRPSESELVIKLKNASEIHVLGLDQPARIEGTPWDGGGVDEFGNVKASAWPENIRPALSDRKGWGWLFGVPEGRNHYYDIDQRAIADDTGEWGHFWWPSKDILPPEEIESARRDLDPVTFDQEYNASFVNFSGRAYYPFTTRTHCAKLIYDPKQNLIFCFDFNVAPGVAVVAQEQKLPNGIEGTGVIGEVYIPQNSNTIAVCNRLIADWKDHQGKITCYGDASGGATGSAKVVGSDWDLINRTLKSVWPGRVGIRVPRQNPKERARVNSVNTRFLNGADEIHMMIDPSKAPWTVRDFEGTIVLEGGSGEIDKKNDEKLTHLTDGLGYYIVYEYPVVTNAYIHQEAY